MAPGGGRDATSTKRPHPTHRSSRTECSWCPPTCTKCSGVRDCRSYFAPGPEERAWGLTVTACGSTRIPTRSRYPLLDHPSDHDRPWETGRMLPLWQVILLTAGRGELETAASGRIE